ncbi:MAG TPA: putative lipid II flippase FtsW [Candidatus Competibacteraceae bacterium]|nr:putative lipid II flippase FtsW [Candidatus Competibacteraceae bacterium]
MLGRILRRKSTSAQEAEALLLIDPWLLVASLLLLALGLLMVTSASIPIADRLTGQPFYFFIRQGIQVGLGLLLALFVFQVPLATWYRSGPLLLLIAVLLLVAVLIPGIGKEVNGSMRWIDLKVTNVQVSELAKLCGFIYVAGYLQRHGEALRTSMMAMIRPLAVLAVLGLLLLLEPDFGATAVLLAVALGMVFLAGVNIWQFAALQLVTLGAMATLLYASPYRRARLASFLDPWADPFNSGFQLTQSLIAIGRGELFGVGLGASVQKLFYLPEAYTDFLFAILAEELGLIGVLTVIGLYGVLVWRAFRVGQHAERLEMRFGAYLAYGIGLWFALQALVNMGVNMGVLPTKGLTLPLMSYGGSSVVVMCMALAVLLRIDLEVRANDPRLQRKRVAVSSVSAPAAPSQVPGP